MVMIHRNVKNISFLNKNFQSCFKFLIGNDYHGCSIFSFKKSRFSFSTIAIGDDNREEGKRGNISKSRIKLELQNQNRMQVLTECIEKFQNLLLQSENQSRDGMENDEINGKTISAIEIKEEIMMEIVSNLLNVGEFETVCSIYFLILENQKINMESLFDSDQSFALYIIDEMLKVDEGRLMPLVLNFVIRLLSVINKGKNSIDPLIWEHLLVKTEDFYDDVALDVLMKHIPYSPSFDKLEEWIVDIYARKQRWDRVRQLMRSLPSRSSELYQVLMEMWLQPIPSNLHEQFIDQRDDEKWEGINYQETRNQLLALKRMGILEEDKVEFGKALETIMKRQALPEKFLSFLENELFALNHAN